MLGARHSDGSSYMHSNRRSLTIDGAVRDQFQLWLLRAWHDPVGKPFDPSLSPRRTQLTPPPAPQYKIAAASALTIMPTALVATVALGVLMRQPLDRYVIRDLSFRLWRASTCRILHVSFSRSRDPTPPSFRSRLMGEKVSTSHRLLGFQRDTGHKVGIRWPYYHYAPLGGRQRAGSGGTITYIIKYIAILRLRIRQQKHPGKTVHPWLPLLPSASYRAQRFLYPILRRER